MSGESNRLWAEPPFPYFLGTADPIREEIDGVFICSACYNCDGEIYVLKRNEMKDGSLSNWECPFCGITFGDLDVGDAEGESEE